ncbi:integral membrane protein [Striga asiatica]|uniref:Integral membrane protein n=1 Tax=Striga asiatica TaxID=4170 RepID=A0A5A7PXG8_STRAF|nr:integral membrane protein [Striga asiatica]
MATQSPWRCHFSCAPTPCLHSSTIFPLYDTKRRPTVPWASSFKSKSSSSSSCACAANTSSSNAKKRLRRKSVGSITVGNDSDDNVVPDSSLNGNYSVINGKFSTFKSLFGKRALWRRILFASRKVRSIILLNVITIIYASNIPVVKEVEAITDPKAFTVVRFCVAAIPFIPFVLQAKVDARTRNAGIELGFWVSLGYILQALGLLTSDAGRASFLSMFTVIVVPLIDGLLGSAIPARTWFGALMSIVGVGLLESSGSPPCIGDLLNFLSAVSFGIHMLRTEHISRSTKRENFLPLLGYEVCVVALLSTAWYFMEGRFSGGIQESDPFSWTFATVLDSISSFPWVPALYTGIFSTGLCLWVEMAAMRDVSATETAIIYGLEPVWGAGFAWVLLGGSLTVQIMGARSDSSSRECKSMEVKSNEITVSDKLNNFSASPVVVDKREDPCNLMKK